MKRRQSRLLILAAVLGLLGLSPAVRPSASGPLAVFDATGQEMGIVLDLGQGVPVVALESGGQLGLVEVGRDGLRAPMSTVGFMSPICAGPPLLLDFVATVSPTAEVLPIFPLTGVRGDQLLISTADASPTLVGALLGPSSTCSAIMGGMILAMAPSTPLLDLTGFLPPFALGGSATGGRAPVAWPVVHDANGQRLSPIAGGLFPHLAAITLRLPGAPVDPVLIDRQRIVFGTTSVVFTAAGCLGPPYLLDHRPGQPKLTRLTGVGPGDRLLGPDGPPIASQVMSMWMPFLSTPCAPVPPGSPQSLVPTAVLLDTGALASPFTVHADTPRARGGREPVGGLELIDAADQPVGPAHALFAMEGLIEVEVAIDAGRTVGPGRFRPERALEGSDLAWFESADCSGPVLIKAPGPTGLAPLLPATALGPGAVLWVETGSPSVLTLQSSWDSHGEICNIHVPHAASVLATHLLRSLGHLRAPFTLR